MPKRIESHEEAISGIDNARQYAEMAKNPGNIMYGSFLDHIKSLGVKGGRYFEVGAGTGIPAAMIAEDNPDVHITAVEISSGMVTVAREYIEEKKLGGRDRFRVDLLKDEFDIRSARMGATYNSILPAAACAIMRASSEVTQLFLSTSASGTYLPLTAIRSAIAASAEVSMPS